MPKTRTIGKKNSIRLRCLIYSTICNVIIDTENNTSGLKRYNLDTYIRDKTLSILDDVVETVGRPR